MVITKKESNWCVVKMLMKCKARYIFGFFLAATSHAIGFSWKILRRRCIWWPPCAYYSWLHWESRCSRCTYWASINTRWCESLKSNANDTCHMLYFIYSTISSLIIRTPLKVQWTLMHSHPLRIENESTMFERYFML